MTHHAHRPLPSASRRLLGWVLIPAALATLVAMVLLWPGRVHVASASVSAAGQQALGTVTAISEAACAAAGPCGTATVAVTQGPGTGKSASVDLPQGPGSPSLRVGSKVVLLYAPDAVPGGKPYSVTDLQRGKPLVWLLVAAALSVLAFGRLRGLTSLLGLAASFGILLLFVIPAILAGSPPLLVAVVGSSAMMFAALYLTHGINVHTSVAVAGTLASLVLTGVLGVAFTSAMHLTGVAGDDDSYLSSVLGGVDLRGLLLAGIVIGALGVLGDVTVTQAETVAELAKTGFSSPKALYRAAGRIGRVHVASAVTTIVLAYAGTSLPLLLLISVGSQPIGSLLTGQFLAQEIMRSAVGTIGLVASVPITTALGVLVATETVQKSSRQDSFPKVAEID